MQASQGPKVAVWLLSDFLLKHRSSPLFAANRSGRGKGWDGANHLTNPHDTITTHQITLLYTSTDFIPDYHLRLSSTLNYSLLQPDLLSRLQFGAIENPSEDYLIYLPRYVGPSVSLYDSYNGMIRPQSIIPIYCR